VISSGPYTIDPGETQRLGFALIGGVDLSDLQLHADAASAKWDEIITLVSVEDQESPGPQTFQLEQNYPNPFNPSTVINYRIPQASFVTLKLYDLLGREVSTLVNTYQSAGEYRVEFDASGLPTGTYFYRLWNGENTAIRKLLLVR
jgi:hypothetical protein